MQIQGLPHFAAGAVVKGFGRGSKQLGIPTANYPLEVIKDLPNEIKCGIYFGWAQIDDGGIYKMVMSIGWNPFYENTEKSMETHIMHTYDNDFYGKTLKVCICGYIRPEQNFNSLDELIERINLDIKTANEQLDLPDYQPFKQNNFFNAS